MLDPVKLVDAVLHDIVFEVDPCPLTKVWMLAEQHFHKGSSLSMSEKSLLWLWLSKQTSNLTFISQETNSVFIPDPVLEKNFRKSGDKISTDNNIDDDSCTDTDTKKDTKDSSDSSRYLLPLFENQLLLKATVQLQWKLLIGVDYSKRNIITDNILPLILAIAKKREHGIIQADLTKAANHDSRSTTGRVAVLLQYDIVFKFYSRHSPYPFLIHSYFKEKVRALNNLKTLAHSYDDQKLEVLSAIKTAHNRIRSVRDIMEQFQCRKSPIAKKRFLNLINRLVEQGVLNRVQAVYDESGQMVPCIQYVKDPKNLQALQLHPNSLYRSNNIDEVGEDPTSFNAECCFFNNNVSIASHIFASMQNSENQSILSINLLKKHINPVGNKMPAHLASLFPQLNVEKIPKIVKDASIDDFYSEYAIMCRYTFVKKVKYFLISNLFNELQKKLYVAGNTSSIYDASLVVNSKYDFFSDRFENDQFSYSELMTYMRRVKAESCPFYIFYDPDDLSKKYVSWRYFPANTRTHLKRIESKKTFISPSSNLVQIAPHSNIKNDPEARGIKRAIDGSDSPPKKIKIEKDNKIINTRPVLKNSELSDSASGAPQKVDLKAEAVSNPCLAISKANFPVTKEKRLRNLLQYMKENDGVLLLRNEDVLELSRRMKINSLMDRKTILRDVQALEDLGILKTKQTKIPGHNVCFMYFADRVFTRNEKDKYFDPDLLFVRKKNYRKPVYEKSSTTVRLYELDAQSFKELSRSGSKNDKKNEAPKEVSVTILAKEERQRIIDNTSIVENRIAQENKNTKKKKSKNNNGIDKVNNDNASEEHADDDFSLTARRIKFTPEECDLICRCVIILRTLSRSRYADFNSIAEYIDKPFITGKILKARWVSIKKCAVPSYNKLFANWRNRLLFGCENGIISIKDLQRKDLSFFNNIWRKLELKHISKVDIKTTSKEKPDKLKLLDNHYVNEENFNFVSGNKYSNLDQYFEPISTFQREKILYNTPFTFAESDSSITYKNVSKNMEYDSTTEMKQILKAFILSDKSNYTPKDALKLLSKIGVSEQVMRTTLKTMENDKEISAMMVDGKTELIINDRLWGICHPSRIFHQNMLKDACKFDMFLYSVIGGSKAIQLPSDISNGAMLAIVANMVTSPKNVELIRYGISLDGYMSKYSIKDLPETFLYSRFLMIFADNASFNESILPAHPVPTGSPCSRIWIDIKGEVNKPVFMRILRLLISLIHDRPGITAFGIHKRISKLLSYSNVVEVCSWLISKKAIEKREYDSLFTTDKFYGVFY